MDNIAGSKPALTWAVHISAVLLVLLWVIPTFGLLVSFVPWFMAGMYDPRLVVPEALASRWQVILRYAVVMPSVATLLLLTSLWGGFGASLGGWLAGLAAAPAALFLERRWRLWREARAG